MIENPMVKRYWALSVGIVLCFVWMVVAGGKDTIFTACTLGEDTYLDGTSVIDGECYALVHTDNGTTFRGFSADGKVIEGGKSYVALVAPLAKNGHCPPTLFQILEENAASRTNGVWELLLLDTRAADGKPTGINADGFPLRVNAWRRVPARIRARNAMWVSDCVFKEISFNDMLGQQNGGIGVLPAATPFPRITSIVKIGHAVEITVADTVPYLTYDVEGALTPNGFGINSQRVARRPLDGCYGGEIKFEVPPQDTAGEGEFKFFRIIRRP